MKISINGEVREIPEGCTVSALLKLLGFEGRRIAVAVNRDVVSRADHETRVLVADDHLEIVQAVQGG